MISCSRSHTKSTVHDEVDRGRGKGSFRQYLELPIYRLRYIDAACLVDISKIDAACLVDISKICFLSISRNFELPIYRYHISIADSQHYV
jgi:hypothetical protein